MATSHNDAKVMTDNQNKVRKAGVQIFNACSMSFIPVPLAMLVGVQRTHPNLHGDDGIL